MFNLFPPIMFGMRSVDTLTSTTEAMDVLASEKIEAVVDYTRDKREGIDCKILSPSLAVRTPLRSKKARPQKAFCVLTIVVMAGPCTSIKETSPRGD